LASRLAVESDFSPPKISWPSVQRLPSRAAARTTGGVWGLGSAGGATSRSSVAQGGDGRVLPLVLYVQARPSGHQHLELHELGVAGRGKDRDFEGGDLARPDLLDRVEQMPGRPRARGGVRAARQLADGGAELWGGGGPSSGVSRARAGGAGSGRRHCWCSRNVGTDYFSIWARRVAMLMGLALGARAQTHLRAHVRGRTRGGSRFA
jgi:hypothetical protein